MIFPEKLDEIIFAYVLAFLLTVDNMHNPIPLMCTKFEV